MGDPLVKQFMVRDIDSFVISREVEAVREWLSSSRTFHIFRDHPETIHPMLAGKACFSLSKGNGKSATRLRAETCSANTLNGILGNRSVGWKGRTEFPAFISCISER